MGVDRRARKEWRWQTVLPCRSRGHPTLHRILCRLKIESQGLWGGYDLLEFPVQQSPGPAYLLPGTPALIMQILSHPSARAREPSPAVWGAHVVLVDGACASLWVAWRELHDVPSCLWLGNDLGGIHRISLIESSTRLGRWWAPWRASSARS